MGIKNHPMADWKSVEEEVRRQWMEQNKDNTLEWNDVAEHVRFGWIRAQAEESRVESIH
ncbi:hypothetical protein [Geosporobacter ferrireducens]|uniref:hypothetical protein n=1 Tax=Geosporobacter ferrireducens TaxID=1424294 RepID=UPI0012E9E27E|nr:hypothetical protein [Geosporobacter ferrireducens]